MDGTQRDDTAATPSALEHRHLRRALEFALDMAREGQKLRPPLKYPAAFKPYMKMSRLPASALGPMRRIVEADDVFRKRIGAGALPDLVDPVGILWLQRPAGWTERIAGLLSDAADEATRAGAAAELHREARKREAAEQVAARSRVELLALEARVVSLRDEIDQLRADLIKAHEANIEARAELIDARNEARHAKDREAAATSKLERAESDRAAAVAARQSAEGVRDSVIADRAAAVVEATELSGMAALAQDLAEQLAALSSPPTDRKGPRGTPRRRALPLPGGVAGDSEAATEYLVRSGASVVIDGYNVAKLGWPSLELEMQRQVLLDAVENVARRYGSDLTVVFDGASVIGASADQRRLVRVVYSPDAVIADDVIRSEVARLPAARHVVVVTNDKAIVTDVRAMGANTVSSDRFVALAKR
ncbi:MAG TPA: NYN domain-containing protein [Ilumatobacteraceae bacterium]|nr:NYN domain-containing protein [Ilumatobacteraceae bacterium]